MYARVVRWEGAEADAMRASAAAISEQAAAGPPEGVPATSFQLLIDPENGKGLAIVLFETEEDMRQGDATLSSMSPPNDGMGQRAGVDFYQVAVDLRV
jgi:hypothetical protein